MTDELRDYCLVKDLKGFVVLCTRCQMEAKVHFSDGCVWDGGGDLGFLKFECPFCGRESDIESV